MDRELSIIIKARDEASKVIQDVGNSAQSTAKDLGNALKGSVVQLGAAFGVMSAGVISSIKAFDESQQVAAQLNQAIKSTGNVMGVSATEVKKLSAALQQQSTFSDEAITQAQTLFVRYGNISGSIMPAATKATLDLATAMGTDLDSAARLVGTALSEPEKNIGRLARTVPALKGEIGDLIVKMAKSGDTAGAQAKLIEVLGTSMGGAALTKAHSLSGQMEILKNNTNDLQETLGKGLVDALAQSVGGFDNLNRSIAQVNTFLQQNKDVLTAVAAAALVVTATFGVLLVAALLVVAGTAGLVIAAIGLVVAAVVGLGVMVAFHFAEISAAAQTLWTNITTSFTNILTTITTFFTAIPVMVTTFTQGVIVSLQNLFLIQIPFMIGFAMGYMLTTIQNNILATILILQQLPTMALAVFSLFYANVVAMVTLTATWLATEIPLWPGRIQDGIATIPGIVGTVFEMAKTAVVTKMAEMFQGVTDWWNKIKDIFKQLTDAATNAFNAVQKGLSAGSSVATAGRKQFGGYVSTTGLALVHAGEFVVSRDMQNGRAPIPRGVGSDGRSGGGITVNATLNKEPDWNALGYRLDWIMRNGGQ